MFDTSFLNDLQQMAFQFQKLAIGLPALIFLAFLVRLLLLSLLTPVCGRAASLAANMCMFVFAALLFVIPETGMTAINWGYGLALRFTGSAGAGGLPGVLEELNQVISEINS